MFTVSKVGSPSCLASAAVFPRTYKDARRSDPADMINSLWKSEAPICICDFTA